MRNYIDIAGEYSTDRSDYHSPTTSCVNPLSNPALQDCDTGPASKMYWRSKTVDGYTYLDYWSFYRYNEFEVGSAPDQDHEGDWEWVTLAVSGTDPNTFDFATFSSHGSTWRYLRDVLYCDGYEVAGSCGAEGFPNQGQRVHAYVAEGSHAVYPRFCDTTYPNDPEAHGCGQTNDSEAGESLWPEKDFDGLKPWGENDNPASLEEFPAVNGWSNPLSANWVDWPGKWGEDGSPLSPGLQSHFANPESYTCTERYTPEGEDCPPSFESMSTSAASFTAPESDMETCNSWSGPFVSLSICNPAQVKQALKEGKIIKKAKTKITGLDKKDSAGRAPGLLQVVGAPLSADVAIPDIKLLKGSIVSIKYKQLKGYKKARFYIKKNASGDVNISYRRNRPPIMQVDNQALVAEEFKGENER